jgi:hypothetical protein
MAEVKEKGQGVTAANFIQMLESGTRVSDFLNALNGLQTPAIPSVATLNNRHSITDTQ